MWWMRLTLPALLFACNDAGYDAVSIRPTYGWTDGCTDVTIGGHGFDDQVTATLDGNPVTGITLPDPKALPLDVGFDFYAITPAGSVGFSDLVVTNGDGQKATVNKAFYYVACAGPGTVDNTVIDGVASGASVPLSGCGFADGMKVQLTDAIDTTLVVAEAPLTLTCLTAVAAFTAPELPDGTYGVLVLDAAGDVVSGGAPCVDTDTADTAGFTAGTCITYGSTTTTTGGTL